MPQIINTEVGDGEKGNLDTIKFMTEVARIRSHDTLCRQLALNILQYYKVPSNYYLKEALAIGDYVKNKVRYVRDPDATEYLQDPRKIIMDIKEGVAQGDCDDMSLLIATLLLSIGHKPFYRAARYESQFGNYNHIYVVDYDKDFKGPKTRIVLDAIIKHEPIGFEVKQVSGSEFAV